MDLEDPGRVPRVLGRAQELIQSGNCEDAVSVAREALALGEELYGRDSADFEAALGSLAGALARCGYADEAERFYRDLLDLQAARYGDDHPFVGTTANELGELLRNAGRYREARPLYERALRIASEYGMSKAVSDVLSNLGLVAYAVGDYREARRTLEESQELTVSAYGENHLNVAVGLDNLAAAYLKLGMTSETEEMLLEANRIFRRYRPGSDPDLAVNLLALGDLYRQLTRYDEAKAHLLDAERIATDAQAAPDILSAIEHNLGFIALDLGEFDQAEAWLRAAVESRRDRRDPGLPFSLAGLASLMASTGRCEQALDLMSEALATDEGRMLDYFEGSSDSDRMKFLGTLQGRSDLFLTIVRACTPFAGAAVQGLRHVLRHKHLGRELAALPLRLATESEREAFRRLGWERAALLMAGPRDDESTESFRTRIEAGFAELMHMERSAMQSLPGDPVADFLSGVEVERVASKLPRDSALVEFAYYEEQQLPSARPHAPKSPASHARYLAFVLQPGAPDDVAVLDLGEATAINQRISELLDTITGGDLGADLCFAVAGGVTLAEADTRDVRRRSGGQPGLYDPAAAEALAKLILMPLAPFLDGVERLILCPDHALAYLPFGILPIQEDQKLLDRCEISYVNTGRDILRWGRGRTRAAGQPVVFCNPDFDLGGREDRPAGPFGPLEGTHLEGARIADLLHAKIFEGEEASERELKGAAYPLVLHLATHAYFRRDDTPMSMLDVYPSHVPFGDVASAVRRQYGTARAWFCFESPKIPNLSSGLALAGANRWLTGGELPSEAEDGLLTAADLGLLDLSETELVVLSACDTGIGVETAGQGVYGLRNSVALAGARTSVMSLWKVPDRETVELMVAFYEGLQEGKRRSEALREAQLALSSRRESPFTWSAFILIGEPGPLDLSPG